MIATDFGYTFVVGDLVRIKRSIFEAESLSFGILIKNVSVKLAFEQGWCDEWLVLVGNNIITVPVSQIWPMTEPSDYFAYINPDIISYK